MKSEQEILKIINSATGSESYHKYSPCPSFPVITDGVLALAEAVGCYWLLDVIGSHQHNKYLDKEFQVWEIKVDKEGSSAVIEGKNDTTLIVSQTISYTNFPLQELTLFLIDGILLLPSEY